MDIVKPKYSTYLANGICITMVIYYNFMMLIIHNLVNLKLPLASVSILICFVCINKLQI